MSEILDKKRILILEDSSQSTYGGGQKISRIVIDALAKKHRLFLLDFTRDSLFQSDVSKYISQRFIIDLNYKKSPITRRVYQAFSSIGSFFKLVRFVKKHQIALLYPTTKLTLVVTYSLHKWLRLPYIFHAHSAFGKSFGNKLLGKMLGKADTVIAVSEYVKDSIEKLNKAIKVKVFYNPIEFNTIKEKEQPRGSSFNIGFFGSFIPEKGVQVLVNAARELENDHRFRFHMFGNGPLLKELETASPKNVFFYGHVNNVEEYLIKVIDIVILPSIIPEACPTIILQAMSKGIPVITTKIGGQQELVSNLRNGLLVPAGSPRAIADAIFALTDSELYSKISENNLRDISRYPDVEVYSRSIRGIFAEINKEPVAVA